MAHPPESRGAPYPAPGSWSLAHAYTRRVVARFERFFRIEAASGVVLLLSAAVALIWANSRWKAVYESLVGAPVGFRIGTVSFERDLHFFINDGLMTVFFFVVGLEIRREIHDGALSSVRRAGLPLIAAGGGMLVPACLFALLNAGRATQHGWGVPMATDIAFALAVLTLLGKRVPAPVRVLLLALAVIDDLGAILVIALFYSNELEPSGFALMSAGLGVVIAMRAIGVKNPWMYVPAGVLSWSGAYVAGIHPTLAGVAIAFLTPVASPSNADDYHSSPAERIQEALHGWVAFFVMPVFAFANSGVSLHAASFSGDDSRVLLGIFAGLVVGKPLGVLLVSWLAVRFGLAELPAATSWRHIAVIGLVAGIGFTMSMFIAELAFSHGSALETAKVAILLASSMSAGLAYAVGRISLRTSSPPLAPSVEA